MSDYIITNDGELMHYGVLGMKWGVHRASKQLSKATTKEERDKAVSKLEKHRGKASKKISKFDKQRVKLQKDVDNHVMKTDVKASKLSSKSDKLKRKAGGLFTSASKAQKLMAKAQALDIKSESLRISSREAKSKLEKNKTMTRLFEEGIANIDKTLLDKGKRVINNK